MVDAPATKRWVCGVNRFPVLRVASLSKIFVAQILTHDLLVVASLLVASSFCFSLKVSEVSAFGTV